MTEAYFRLVDRPAEIGEYVFCVSTGDIFTVSEYLADRSVIVKEVINLITGSYHVEVLGATKYLVLEFVDPGCNFIDRIEREKKRAIKSLKDI